MVIRQRGVISMPPSLPNSSGQSAQRLLCVDSFNRHAVGQIAKVPLTMDCCFLRAKRSLALQPPVAQRPHMVQEPAVAQTAHHCSGRLRLLSTTRPFLTIRFGRAPHYAAPPSFRRGLLQNYIELARTAPSSRPDQASASDQP